MLLDIFILSNLICVARNVHQRPKQTSGALSKMKKQQAQLSYERPPDDDYEEKAKTLGFVPLSRGSSAAERIEAQINTINASSNAADSAWNSATLHGDADDDFNQMHNPGSVDP